MDGLTELVGLLAAVSTAGWIKGHIDTMVERRREKAAALLPAKPMCDSCEPAHGLGRHDPETGRCMAEVQTAVEWERNPRYDDDDYEDEPEVIAVKWELRPCGCVRYTGPEPLVTLVAPELSDSAVEITRREV